jgi:hypothetical protein
MSSRIQDCADRATLLTAKFLRSSGHWRFYDINITTSITETAMSDSR